MKKTYQFIIFGIILFLLIGSIIFFTNQDKKNLNPIEKYGDDIIKRTSYQEDIKKNLLGSGSENNLEEVDQEGIDEIKSFVRAICGFYDTPESAINSKYFTGFKSKIEIYKEKYKNNDKFNYILLPEIIYSNCNGRDENYSEYMLMYTQMEGENVLLSIEEYEKEMIKYISNITFPTEGVNKDSILKDKNYFDNYFFKTALEELSSIYFPFFIKNKKDLNTFLNKPRTNKAGIDLQAEAMFVLEYNLKTIGIKDILEFKKLISNNYNTQEKDKFLEQIFKQHESFLTLAKNNGFDLDFLGKDITMFKDFIKSGKAKKMLENDKIYTSLGELYKNLFIYDILGNDYADNYSEDWLAEQFFGDKEKGNSLIRLKFIYFLSL